MDAPREVYRWGGDGDKKGKEKLLDEDGNPISPHIPNFISRAPWYAQGEGSVGLKHQRLDEQPAQDRDLEAAPIKRIAITVDSTVCRNCGTLGHSHRDCLERPKETAKFAAVRAGEVAIVEGKRDFDAKRDRWAGYDPREYEEVIKKYEKLENFEEERSNEESDSSEAEEMPGQKVDLEARTRMTVRNLRMREDTAKYLKDLTADPSQYHPKTRSLLSEQQSWQRKSTQPDESFVWERKEVSRKEAADAKLETIPQAKETKSKKLADLESLYK